MGNELEQYRGRIDALDDQIIGLLKDRLGVVRQVAEYKRRHHPGQFPIRAGREAKMLRRIAEIFKGSDFAPAAAAQLWRIIIGTSTALEGSLAVSVYAPEKERDLYWLAREYFGPAATISRQPHIKRVIGDVMDGKASIGVIPPLNSQESSSWWGNLLQSGADAPKIFAHLPFVYCGDDPKHFPSGLAFSRVAPEESGDDISLYALDIAHEISQHKLQTALGAAGINANWVGIASPSPGSRQHLVELRGFITPESDAFKAFLASLNGAITQSYFLGAYAVPFTIKND